MHFIRPERMRTDPMFWLIRREFFRVGLKKGGPKFKTYHVPPFYINGLRLTTGSQSRTDIPIYLNRILFNIVEHTRFFWP
jgi:hypothetical protein